MHIDAATEVVTLLGDPVEHSHSPTIHNAAFRAQDVNAVYLATQVHPEALEAAVAGLRALGFIGANVTVPHKEVVRPFLDTVSDRAAAVGAVNTIVRDEQADGPDLLRGDNTDVEGFLTPLEKEVGGALDGESMLVFGAGGASRAVVYGLLAQYSPEQVTIVARRPAQAEALASDLAEYDAKGGLRVSTFETAGPSVRASRLVVNATPLGMAPDHRQQTPWTKAEDFGPEDVVYDLVYTPEETRFLREAGAQGATTIGGLDMLVEQAAAAYQKWTGQSMPRDAVYKVLQS